MRLLVLATLGVWMLDVGFRIPFRIRGVYT